MINTKYPYNQGSTPLSSSVSLSPSPKSPPTTDEMRKAELIYELVSLLKGTHDQLSKDCLYGVVKEAIDENKDPFIRKYYLLMIKKALLDLKS